MKRQGCVAGARCSDIALFFGHSGLRPAPDTKRTVSGKDAQDRRDEPGQTGRSRPTHNETRNDWPCRRPRAIDQHEPAGGGDQLAFPNPVVHLCQTNRVEGQQRPAQQEGNCDNGKMIALREGSRKEERRNDTEK